LPGEHFRALTLSLETKFSSVAAIQSYYPLHASRLEITILCSRKNFVNYIDLSKPLVS